MRALLSARLGADFGKIWTASAVSTIGDGVTMAAGPLLVASLTTSPVLVGGAVFAQQLPWVLLSLVSGAFVDRLDRRRLSVAVDLVRALAIGSLALTGAAHSVSVPIVYGVFFALGACDTLAIPASVALLPAVVDDDQLAEANSRLMATFTVGNQFLAKPLGAWLFAVSAPLPFGVDALTFLASAALLATVRPRHTPPPRPRTRLRTDIREGIAWLASHRLLRTLAASMAIGNIAFCGAFAVFVLYASHRLGLSDFGYGLLLTAFAVGGLIGSATAARLQKRFGATVLLRTGLLIEAAVHATLAATTTAWMAAAVLVVFSVHAMVWGVIAETLRQRSTPAELQGRVASVYRFCDLGGAAVGSLVGGLVAGVLGLTAPFWISSAMMLGVAAIAWQPLRAAG